MSKPMTVDQFVSQFGLTEQADWLKQNSTVLLGYRTIPLEIGRRLKQGKEFLSKQAYKVWVCEVLRFGTGTASNYLRAFEVFGDIWAKEPETIDNIQLTAMYVLAGRKEYHSQAVAKALEMARQGELVDRLVANSLIEDAKPQPAPVTLIQPDFDEIAELAAEEEVGENISRISARQFCATIADVQDIARYPVHLLQNMLHDGFDPDMVIAQMQAVAERLKQCAEQLKQKYTAHSRKGLAVAIA